jgi:hypothetical protein
MVAGGSIKMDVTVNSSGFNFHGKYMNYTGMHDCNNTNITEAEDCVNFVRTNFSFCNESEIRNFSCGDGTEVEMCRCSNGRWQCDVPNVVLSCGNRTIEMIKERIHNRTNMTFIPWQKRNESECMEGCICRGAVVSCMTENGRTINITAGSSGNYVYIYSYSSGNGANVSTNISIETYQNGNVVKVKTITSNGSEVEIKIMPDEAQERCLEKVKVRSCNSENNCNLTLKEEKNRIKYQMQLKRHAKLFGLFSKKMEIRAEIDAENGEVTMVAKPWWAFMATEPKE